MNQEAHGRIDPTAQLEAVLSVSRDAIFTKDLDGKVLSWSNSARRMYGYTVDEIVGLPVTILFPPDQVGECAEILSRISMGEEVRDLQTKRIAKDGRSIDVAVTVVPIRRADGAIIGAVTVGRDVTELKAAERLVEELRTAGERRSIVMETASQVALDILSSRTGVEALRHIADAARMLTGAKYAALGVATADGTGLTEFVTVGLSPPEEQAIGRRPRGMGVLGALLNRAEPLRLNDIGCHSSSVGFPPNHPPMKSFLGVPIRRGETVVGSLYLTDKIDSDAFTEEDEIAVQSLGSHAAVAVHNMQMLFRQRALVKSLINAQEEERRAIAYDLHDGLTQFVMAAHMHLQASRIANGAGNEAKAARETEHGMKHLHDAVLESRRLVNGLRTLALDDLGLAGAVEQMLNEEKAHAAWTNTDLIHNIAEQRFAKTVETAAYRVVQEALTNIRKHAGPTAVRILLLKTEDSSHEAVLQIEVRDWGVGFHPEEKVGDYSRVGLESMSERIGLLGGTFTISSAPGEGTTVAAILPAAASDEDRESTKEQTI